jgi:hypothetical protein
MTKEILRKLGDGKARAAGTNGAASEQPNKARAIKKRGQEAT